MEKKESKKSQSIDEALTNAKNADKKGYIIMRELPTDEYFEETSNAIKKLTEQGYEGVYLSFQRPFSNISDSFQNQGIDMDKMLVIDAASALCCAEDKKGSDPHCVPIEKKTNVDELVKAIYSSLPKLHGKKHFVFIDSLTTITLYKPLSETIRFSDFLVKTVRRSDDAEVTLIFNVSKDLSQKDFIRDVAFKVDEVVEA
mgnify:CR=1 FL=1